jgi:hypothetical protein
MEYAIQHIDGDRTNNAVWNLKYVDVRAYAKRGKETKNDRQRDA